jgi:IS4 transposase
VEAGDYLVFDRGYVDYARLYRLDQAGAWFVIRAKCNMCFYVCESKPVDKTTGLRCDQTIRLNSKQAHRDYPKKLRRIRYYDAENDLSLVFLTNNFTLPALVIAAIYRRRWEIELFFRWIKQHLRLRGFFSINPNGVAVQIWTAICAYLLVAIAKHEMALPGSLHQVLQIVSISALEKIPLPELFTKFDTTDFTVNIPIQMDIIGF